MMILLNGQERTVTHLCDLLSQASWKLTAVYNNKSSLAVGSYQKAVAIPV
jgi:hypothetical protein